MLLRNQATYAQPLPAKNLENSNIGLAAAKAKVAVAAPVARRGALRDVTNVQHPSEHAGRVKKVTKASSHETTKAGSKRTAPTRVEESTGSLLTVENGHKRRRSDPLDDPMDVVVESEPMITSPIKEVQPLPDQAVSSIPHDNIDLYDEDDPQSVVEYVDDIYTYMRGLEVRHHELPLMLLSRPFVNSPC